MLGYVARICSALPVALAVIAGLTVTSVSWVLTATVYVIGGVGWETLDDDTMEAIAGGMFNDGTNTFVNIPWLGKLGEIGTSAASASNDLYALIRGTEGAIVAIGASGSTMAINDVMRRAASDFAANDPTAPDPDDITFVVLGDAERSFFPALTPFFGQTLPGVNYTVQPIPVTPYDVMVVNGEYDGAADWPNRPFNLLAVANALAGSGAFEGFGSVHFDAIFTDPATVPAENVTTTVNALGGVTTTYLVPTPDLPLLRPLPTHGVPKPAVDALTALLRPVVDFGYSRNDWRPPTGGMPRSATRPQRGAQIRAQINTAPVSATPIAATEAMDTGSGTTASGTTATRAMVRRAGAARS